MAKVKIKVEFYNEEEKQLFKNNYEDDVFDELNRLTKEKIKVSVEDFRTYAILKHLNPSFGSLGSLNTLLKNRNNLLGEFDYYFDFDKEQQKLTSKISSVNEQNQISETLGVAGALCVVGAAFGTTPADWSKILISKHKDFDFKSAVSMDNSKLIVVEAKGSIVEDNSKKEDPIYQHKSKIKAKKNDQYFKNKYSNGVDILVGGITVADIEHHLKVFLVDPPAKSELSDNFRRNIKLLKRLHFYSFWIHAMGARSDLSKALINRLSSLEILSDPFELENKSLRKSNSEEMTWDQSQIDRYSYVNDEVVGKVIAINNKSALFFGLKTELFDYLMGQKYGLISSYKTSSKTTDKDMVCILRNNKDNQVFITENFESEVYSKSDKDIRFYANGVELMESSSGLCFGIIKNENIEYRRKYWG
jgi:hypothetical protein